MSIGSSKSKPSRSILAIFGVLLLLFGILSLTFQYSNTTVSNMNAYAQVDLGPFVPIGPPNRSTALDSVSDGTTIYVSYAAEQQGADDRGVYLGLLNSGPGGRGESLQDTPENVIPDGEDPAIAVGGGNIYVTGTRDGEGDIAITECDADDDDCEPPQSASNPAPPIETSCFDGVDGDGDGLSDEEDPDCFDCFIIGKDLNTGAAPSMQFVSGNGGGGCPVEPGPLCDDGLDNDGDTLIDEEDPDCSLEGGTPFGLNCADGIDNDEDGLTDVEDPGCNEAGEEACSDGIDNDGDGLTDGDDPGCVVEPPAIEGEGGVASCADGLDNDGDELVDGEDPDCQGPTKGGEPTGLCSDGEDNDGDELTDEEDPDCAIVEPTIETSCFDGVDGDGDGVADELDSDCTPCFILPDSFGFGGGEEARLQFVSISTLCPFEPGPDCDDGVDNDGDGLIDEADPDCGIEGGHVVGPNCGDGIDNDDDGATDSADPGCNEAGEEACSDGIDNDGDGAVDSEDLSCTEPASFNPLSNEAEITFVQNGDDTTPPATNSDVATASDGDDVYIVWEQEGDIMFRAGHECADANGCEFGDILNLSNNAGTSREPRVATSSSGQFVHVAWQDNSRGGGNDEIFYSRSTNFGATFNGGSTDTNPVGPPRNLSNTPRASNDLQLLTEGARVYVVWVDFTTGNGDIYFKKSTNNGGSFSSTINLSRGSGFSFLSSRDPDMAAQGSRVSVVWTVYPSRTATGPGEIIWRESSNSGSSFGSHVVVSKTPRTDSKEPQVDYVPGYSEKYFGWNDRGGPQRVHTTPGTFNVLAAQSDSGRTVSPSVNLSDAPNNPDKTKNTSQLQVLDDVAVMDPGGRRG
jgi:hypothetical protein